jgi:HD-GYP domain-containing protein (c-di-GMP phosphodiesterase class II)
MLYKEMPYPIVREDQSCMMDLYVKIKNDYRLFAAKGAMFTKEHCRLFTKSKATLYIRTSENETGEEYLNSYLNDLISDSRVEPEVKAEIVYTSSMKSIRQIFQGLNRRTLAELEKTSEIVAKLILADRRIMNNLMRITSHDHFTYRHSVRVGIYGTALAVHLFGNTRNDHNIAALCTALFLHDIGMTRVPNKILDKKEPLSDLELQIVRKHPVWGHDKLMNANYLTSQAASIVLFHHERCNGKGYPFGKSAEDIPLYAKICAIADTFESLTFSAPSGEPRTPFESLSIMQQEMAQEFDANLFKAFIMMLGPGA